jgi:hypothetical protein
VAPEAHTHDGTDARAIRKGQLRAERANVLGDNREAESDTSPSGGVANHEPIGRVRQQPGRKTGAVV